MISFCNKLSIWKQCCFHSCFRTHRATVVSPSLFWTNTISYSLCRKTAAERRRDRTSPGGQAEAHRGHPATGAPNWGRWLLRIKPFRWQQLRFWRRMRRNAQRSSWGPSHCSYTRLVPYSFCSLFKNKIFILRLRLFLLFKIYKVYMFNGLGCVIVFVHINCRFVKRLYIIRSVT